MPAMRRHVRNYNLIGWTDLDPDFAKLPMGDLTRRLPFLTVCSLLLDQQHEPRVVVSSLLMEEIIQHLSEKSVEMGGLLIGTVHSNTDESNFVVSVESSVRSADYDGTSVSLRMNSSVWEAARNTRSPSQSVIGWYHSHPNLGAFFSGTDRRTQKSFFNLPHCLGLVIDPVRHEQKWFMGPDSEELTGSQVLSYDRHVTQVRQVTRSPQSI